MSQKLLLFHCAMFERFSYLKLNQEILITTAMSWELYKLNKCSHYVVIFCGHQVMSRSSFEIFLIFPYVLQSEVLSQAATCEATCI